MEDKTAQNNGEKIILEGRKKLSMFGVVQVDGFSDKYLKLSVDGSRVVVTGTDIKITGYNKATGNLTADGLFSSITYQGAGQPIMKKLFK